jgi:hypothetical protein
MFTQCRATFLRSQALIAAVVALAACGHEGATEPIVSFSRVGGDTVGMLRTVASAIREMNARADTARTAADYPANCRRNLVCWSVETEDWFVLAGDRSTRILADFLGLPAPTVSTVDVLPWCPRGETSRAGAGFRTAVLIRFTSPDLARVAVTNSCYERRGETRRGFQTSVTFEVRRADDGWTATLYSVGVT